MTRALLFLALMLQGCVAVTVVETAVDVTATAVETTVDVATYPVRVIVSDDDDDDDDDD
ncbi:MAG: NF038104 family lipoprotein [Pseudomonadota bacterium]